MRYCHFQCRCRDPLTRPSWSYLPATACYCLQVTGIVPLVVRTPLTQLGQGVNVSIHGQGKQVSATACYCLEASTDRASR